MRYEARREYEAVGAAAGDRARRRAAAPPARRELARRAAPACSTKSCSTTRARAAAYERLLALRPDDDDAAEALERADAKRGQVARPGRPLRAGGAGRGDPRFRSSLLVSAAEVVVPLRTRRGTATEPRRAHRRPAARGARARPEEPPRRDAARAGAARRRSLGRRGRRRSSASPARRRRRTRRSPAGCGSPARFAKKLKSPDRAAAAYERVLDSRPGSPRRRAFLVRLLHVARDVGPPRRALRGAALGRRAPRQGRGVRRHRCRSRWSTGGCASGPTRPSRGSSALRKLEPAHPGMLAFFREWCAARGETHAPRADPRPTRSAPCPTGPSARRSCAEIAKLAEEGANAQKAIEQWRTRAAAGPAQQRRARRAQAPLPADGELERADRPAPAGARASSPPDDAAGRLPVLREIAAVYRDAREERLGARHGAHADRAARPERSRRACASSPASTRRCSAGAICSTMQARLAELEPEPGVKAELCRAVARRWLEQFSNVQNAVEAYEKLHAVDPATARRSTSCKELYVKRRAYKPLYELLGAGGRRACRRAPARRELWIEMAKLAAERLDMGAQAVAPLQAGARRGARRRRPRSTRSRSRPSATRTSRPSPRCSSARGASLADDAPRARVLQKLGAHLLRPPARPRQGDERVAPRARAAAGPRQGAARPARQLPRRRRLRRADRALRENKRLGGARRGPLRRGRQGDRPGARRSISSFRCADDLRRAARTRPSARSARTSACSPSRPTTRARPRRSSRSTRRTRSGGACRRSTRSSSAHAERRRREARAPREARAASPATSSRTAPRRSRGRARRTSSRRRARARSRRSRPRRAPPRSGPGFVEALTPASRRSSRRSRGRAPARRSKKKDRENGDDGRPRGDARPAREARRGVRARDGPRRRGGRGVPRARRGGRGRRARRADARSHPARGRPPRRPALALRPARRAREHGAQARAPRRVGRPRGGGLRRARARRRPLPAHARDRAAPRRARSARSRGCSARRATPQGAVEVIALDRDQREGAERAAREVELARLLVDPLHRYVDALAACERALELSPNDPRAIEVVEQLLAGRRDPRARRGASSSAPTTRPARRSARPRCSRCSSRRRRRATTASRSTAASPTCTSEARRRERRLRRRRARRRRVPDASSPLWDRLAVLAADDGTRAGTSSTAIVAAVPAGGRDGPARARRARSRRARRDALRREARRRRPRAPVPRAHARAAARQRAGLPAPQADPDDARAVGRARGALRARRRGDARTPSRRAELLAEVALVAEEITGDRAKAIALLRADPRARPVHEQAMRSLDSAVRRRAALGPARAAPRAAARGAPWATRRLDLEQRLGTLLFTQLGDAAGALAYLEHVLRERPSATRGAAARREDPRRAGAALARGDRPRGRVHRARRGARARARARDPPRVRRRRPTSGASSCGASPSCATSGCGTTRARSRPSRGSCRSTPTTRGRASACSRSRAGSAPTSAPRASSRPPRRRPRRRCRAPRS